MAGGISTGTKVVQITNVAPQATKDQMQSLFGNIGKIDEIRLYPTVRDVSCPVQSRICYVKYFESSCVAVAQHLTNTVFIDRALIVIPVQSIPEEYRALEMSKNGTIVPGLQKAETKLPPEVVNRLEGQIPQQVNDFVIKVRYNSHKMFKVVMTYDPKLKWHNLPPYPALPAYLDSRKIEEIRRTILVVDVRDEWLLDDLMEYFSRAGEVKYARWAEKDGKTHCMIEFCQQRSVIEALKLQGSEFRNGYLNIYHSTEAIAKPEAKSNEAAQKEIEEAMTLVKEAQSIISAAIDPVIGMLAKEKRRHGSRSRRKSRSRSRGSRRKSRSRSRTSRRKSRSRSRGSRRRSRSRSKVSRRKSRSRSRGSRRKSRSRSRDRRRSSRSRRRSHSRSRRSRSRDRKKSHRSKDERKRSRSRSKRHSSSRGRSSHSKDKKSSSSKRRSRTPKSRKTAEESIIRDYDAEEKIGYNDDKKRSPSVEKSDNMDISNSP
ncbi:probable splicing factor, arginine/serine-rich 7 isoform X1 [Condylostylus longicornis]|uniref:probable splicing factor, arginine/serine-rich 7 isoform X1 n=1 Tax=Condylostylus longicornis TaxID=2530218 RepID=UPI00244E2C87|nr:probable splicing factor, arginine/serine-rich 7 isoform X1 [Condylostylus longicornis]